MQPRSPTAPHPELARAFGYWPTGWLHENAAEMLLFALRLQATADVKEHRVYVDRVDELTRDVEHLKLFWRFVPPWHMLYYPATELFQRETFPFARAAVYIDHSILACGLERYRLGRGKYPETLAELAPLYCGNAPHDVMTGEPYRYRVLPDGGYLLYSVGSNGVDDGGKIVVISKPWGNSVDADQGDWVWFGAK